MAELDNSGLGDLGLLANVSNDVLGDPDKVEQLKQQLMGLQAVLSQPPPAQSRTQRLLSAMAQGIAGGLPPAEERRPGQDVVGGLAGGLLAGLEGSKAEAVRQYEAKQKQAQSALDHQEKLAAGIRMVLAQNPLALEPLAQTDEGQRMIGMLAFGLDVPIDPTTKSREADETLQKKQRIAYYTKMLTSAQDPQARAMAAQGLMDNVDPDGTLFKPEDFARKPVPSFSEVARVYGDPGLRALSSYGLSGDLDALYTSLGSLRKEDPAKMPPSMRLKLELARKIADVKQEYFRINGKELTDLDAIKQLPDEDRILAENQFRNIGGGEDEVSFSRYISTQERALDDLRASDPEAPIEELVPAASALAWQRINAARFAAKRVKQADQRERAKTTASPPEKNAAPVDYSAWRKALAGRLYKNPTMSPADAEKALVMEYIQQGKRSQVPPPALTRTGM